MSGVVYKSFCASVQCDGIISELEMYMFKNSCSYSWMGSSDDELRDVFASGRLNVLAWQYAHASTDQRGAGTF